LLSRTSSVCKIDCKTHHPQNDRERDHAEDVGGFHVSSYPVTDSNGETYLLGHDHTGGQDRIYLVAEIIWDSAINSLVSDGTYSGSIRMVSQSGNYKLDGSWKSNTAGRQAECSAGCSHWVAAMGT